MKMRKLVRKNPIQMHVITGTFWKKEIWSFFVWLFGESFNFPGVTPYLGLRTDRKNLQNTNNKCCLTNHSLPYLKAVITILVISYSVITILFISDYHLILVRAALCRRCLTAVGHYFAYIFPLLFFFSFGPSVLRAPAEQTKVATVLGNWSERRCADGVWQP